MDQNLGDTNVMYHKLLDQYFRSQSIKVSINIGIKQNLRTQLSGRKEITFKRHFNVSVSYLREHNRAKGNGMDFKLVSEL